MLRISTEPLKFKPVTESILPGNNFYFKAGANVVDRAGKVYKHSAASVKYMFNFPFYVL